MKIVIYPRGFSYRNIVGKMSAERERDARQSYFGFEIVGFEIVGSLESYRGAKFVCVNPAISSAAAGNIAFFAKNSQGGFVYFLLYGRSVALNLITAIRGTAITEFNKQLQAIFLL